MIILGATGCPVANSRDNGGSVMPLNLDVQARLETQGARNPYVNHLRPSPAAPHEYQPQRGEPKDVLTTLPILAVLRVQNVYPAHHVRTVSNSNTMLPELNRNT